MRNLQILHLEDDAFDADLVHREVGRLAQPPVWVHVASAEAFFAAMELGGFDAILSDNRVEGIEGIRAMEVAKARYPEVPFIFISGNADPRWAQYCLAAGATDYVPKDQLWRLSGTLQRLNDAREVQRLTTLTRGRATLVDAVRELSLARSVDAIVDIVRRAARQLNQADGATVILRDGDLCHYVDEDAISPLWKGGRFPMTACISGWAMLHGQPAVVPDIAVDDRIPQDAYRPTFVKSLVMVPIRAEAPIGAIGNYWACEHDATPDEVQLIQALADATSLAFENVFLVESLEQRVRQRTIELEAANRELEAFSYSVSHDLRAPLRAVQGYSGLLATDMTPPLEGEARRFVENIQTSAQRMSQLIDDMLTLSNVTRVDMGWWAVDLTAMAREIIGRLQAETPGRQVSVDIDNGLVAHGDPGLLRLALENLLSNAWKFTGKRDDARIAFRGEVDSDGSTTLLVEDNGAGFDMAYAHQLFEPFRRLHRDADFPGTGVGLAIVRRVVERHGGRIEAHAARGEGACFRVTLRSMPYGRAATPGS